jgi:hypothetical protein
VLPPLVPWPPSSEGPVFSVGDEPAAHAQMAKPESRSHFGPERRRFIPMSPFPKKPRRSAAL